MVALNLTHQNHENHLSQPLLLTNLSLSGVKFMTMQDSAVEVYSLFFFLLPQKKVELASSQLELGSFGT